MSGRSIQDYALDDEVIVRFPLLPIAQAFPADLPKPHSAEIGNGVRDSPAGVIEEAIFLANRSLWREWLDRSRSGRMTDSLDAAVRRYITRLASRPTPFGILAGIAVGVLNGPRNGRIDPSRAVRKVRLSRPALFELECATNLRMRSSPTAGWQLCETWRVADGMLQFWTRGGEGKLLQKAVPLTSPIELLVELAHGQGRARPEYVHALARAFGDQGRQAAEELVAAAMESGLLVPNAAAPLVSDDALDDLRQAVLDAPLVEWAADLGDLAELVRAANGPIGNGIVVVNAVQEKLDDMLEKRSDDDPVVVDLTLEEQLGIHAPWEGDLRSAIDCLWMAFGVEDNKRLSAIAKRMREQYGDENAVPLMQVVDADESVMTESDGSDPLNDWLVGWPLSSRQKPEREWTDTDEFQAKLVEKASEGPCHELWLTETDRAPLKNRRPLPLAGSFSALCRVLLRPDGTPATPHVLLLSVISPPGRLVARFGHTQDNIRQMLHRWAVREQEQVGDAIMAEVVHMPQPRIGNVLSRPAFHEWEVPVMTRGSKGSDRTIPVHDLLIAPVNGRLILWSQGLQREVVPRQTTAHGVWYGKHANAYRLLSDLASQGITGAVGWRWRHQVIRKQLPRIRIGNCVLARRQWFLTQDEVRALFRAITDGRAEDLLSLWRAHGLPDSGALAYFDRELAFSRARPASLRAAFAWGARRGEGVKIYEAFPPTEECKDTPPDVFVGELLLTFHAPLATTPKRSGLGTQRVAGIRDVEKGWLSFHLYTSKSGADRLICNDLEDLLRRVHTVEPIAAWFFLRYRDPQWHVRLRIRVDDGPMGIAAMTRQLEELQARGAIRRYELRTYHPEINRYGGAEALRISQKLFQASSERVPEMLRAAGEGGGAPRWLATAAGADAILRCGLESLSAGAESAGAVARVLRSAYRKSKALQARLGSNFRERRKSAELILARPTTGRLWNAIGDFEVAMQGDFERLRQLVGRGAATRSMAKVALTLCHMHINRMERTAERAAEMVIMDTLHRLYRSAVARGMTRWTSG